MSENIFDLKNIQDLPEKFIKFTGGNIINNLLNLFNKKEDKILSIDEIMASYYRVFNIALKRTSLSSNLWRMVKEGKLEKVKYERAIYKLITNIENI